VICSAPFVRDWPGGVLIWHRAGCRSSQPALIYLFTKLPCGLGQTALQKPLLIMAADCGHRDFQGNLPPVSVGSK
jgi:hypothetical protein